VGSEGYAIRDADSTTYVGAIRDRRGFGKQLYLEAWNAAGAAQEAIVMRDRAELSWNLAEQHSWCVNRRSLSPANTFDIARMLHPNDAGEQKAWMKVHQKRLLDRGKIEKLVDALRHIRTANPEVVGRIHTEAAYFERNADRMRYPQFRRQHLFVGSGVIEAGCKTVIGSRLKQSGMFWTVRGANAILSLRCCQLNRRFENYWEARLAG
jgi:hypothetical protein